MLEYLFVCSKRNTFMGTETSKNPLLFLYYQGSLFPFFLGKRRRAALHCIREKSSPLTTPISHTGTKYER